MMVDASGQPSVAQRFVFRPCLLPGTGAAVPLWFLAKHSYHFSPVAGPAVGSMRNVADFFLGSLSTLARRASL
jgi:hypothetical protein